MQTVIADYSTSANHRHI